MSQTRTKIKPCCKATLQTLASALRKVLTPEQFEELKWACDPLGMFLEKLQQESQS